MTGAAATSWNGPRAPGIPIGALPGCGTGSAFADIVVPAAHQTVTGVASRILAGHNPIRLVCAGISVSPRDKDPFVLVFDLPTGLPNWGKHTVKTLALVIAALCIAAMPVFAAADGAAKKEPSKTDYFAPTEQVSEGSVTAGGHDVSYKAIAGTIVVHPQGWDDFKEMGNKDAKDATDKDNPSAEASMFFTAYFKKGAKAADRPVTFLFNGGPGSATMWLHMGAFGPRRVVTNDDTHTPPAPYRVVDNEDSLLDVSDLVFIDAPGTGFSRIAGKDKEKAFYGVDPDAHAFAEFIKAFLSRYDRWNSPKYLFGESYGTTRSAALSALLTGQYNIELNGVILLSQILSFDMSADEPQLNPGVDLPYQLVLPTYAATAWYHHKLPQQPAALDPFLAEVEQFAMGDYAHALAQGAVLSDGERDAVAEKLHQYTGLPVAYIKKANLRVNGGEFEKTLLGDDDMTTGRLDTRFSGPTLDPLSKEAEYDPQDAAISAAYVAAFNQYVREDLHYGKGLTYKPGIDGLWRTWDHRHKPPGADSAAPVATNVLPDLATAMKLDPDLKVMLNMGYFDLATPFFEGIYEMRHLPIPQKLQANISYKFYESGHMVYAHPPALRALHDNVAQFIRDTDNLSRD